MQTTYYPDRWLILKTPQCAKVFGVWCGGYTTGDSWKLNSGITKIEEFDDYYLFHGYSGSIYHCRKNSYGSTAYGYSVVQSFGDQMRVIANTKQEINAVAEKRCLQTR
jgi:hypothetical protein